MTDIDQGAALGLDDDEPSPRGRTKSKLKFYAMILGGLLLLGGAGGAIWYFVLGGRDVLFPLETKKTEAPLPYFFDMKPFVVTTASRSGPGRFVQLGLSLELPGSTAGDLITAILPQVQDVIRQTVLSFKSEDLQSPEGLEKVRAALMISINKSLPKDLGRDRIEKVNPGKPPDELIANIYFSQLIVE